MAGLKTNGKLFNRTGGKIESYALGIPKHFLELLGWNDKTELELVTKGKDITIKKVGDK